MVSYPAARPFLATLPEYPSIGESVAFQLNGLIVVFIALGSIWGLLELMGVFFRRQKSVAPPASAAPAPVAPTPTPPAAAGLTPELTVVIAAAVSTVLRQPHRIHSIAAEPASSDWAHEGRREIFGSHRIR